MDEAMSASREKKKRFEERGDGVEKRQVRAKEDFKLKKRKKLITSIVAVVVVVLIVVGVVFNSNLFYTGVPALKIGDSKYTTSDFNYEYFNAYYNTYTNMQNSYGSYASMFLNPQEPLDKQMYSDTQTWDDYFEEQAIEHLKQMTILNDMADAENWELSAAQKSEIEANIDSLKTAAASNNYGDYRAYIRALYGKGVTEDRLRSLLQKSYRATYYSQFIGERTMAAFTDEELDDYYDSVCNDYDLVSFMAYTASAEDAIDAGIDTETAMAEAKTVADEILSARDQATFAEAVYQFAPESEKSQYAKEDACLHRFAAPAGISNPEWRSWLTDPARQAGDTTIVEFSTGYHVLLFLERSDNAYELVNFRGITINVGTDEETGEVTDETRAAAQELVDSILEEFEADPTEEKFAALADEYDNSGENLSGGLYENVILGTLANPDVEAYLFGDTKVGEVQTLYSDGKFYITYPLEKGERYDRFIAKNMKQNEQYTEMMETASADYPVSTGFAFRFAK